MIPGPPLSSRGGAHKDVTVTHARCKSCSAVKRHIEFEMGCAYRCPVDVSPNCLDCLAANRRQRALTGWPDAPIVSMFPSALDRAEQWAQRYMIWHVAKNGLYRAPNEPERDEDVFVALGAEMEQWLKDNRVSLDRLPLQRFPLPGSLQISATTHWQSQGGLLMTWPSGAHPPAIGFGYWVEYRARALQEMRQIERWYCE